MFDETYYEDILRKYPTTISKEQICKACHISKRVAKVYLDNGIIPCVNTGRATHKYTAKTADVIEFMRKRAETPGAYRVILKDGKPYHPSTTPKIEYTPSVLKRYRQMITTLISPYPDLMTVQMIAELTGYSTKTIQTWTPQGHLRWFRNGVKYYAPKETVIEHMMGEEFRNITGKSKKHRWMILELIDRMMEEA